MRRFRRLGALRIVLTVILGACEGADPAAGPSGTPSETIAAVTPSATVTPSASAEASPAASPPPGPDQGGVLTVAIQEPTTLDPMRAQDPGSVLVVRQLFEGLTRWDPVAEEVVPAAARSWDISDEGRRFTFHLQRDLRWHDGSPVTSHDFKAAFDRIALRKNASDLAYTLERVDGFIQVNQLGRGKHLRGVRAPDDSTLIIELTHPYYDWPAVLTHPGLVPIPEQAERHLEKFLVKPIGNGSFRMKQPWEPGQTIVLDAFDRGVADPNLDGVRFMPFDSAATSWPHFDAGELDVAEVPVGRFDYAVETYGEDGVTPLLAGYYYGMNLRSRNLKSERLRRAITLAIDRDTIAEDIYKGSMAPPRGIVPEGLPGFGDNVCRCEYSPDRAQSIVARLRPKLRSIRVEYTRGSPHGRVADRVAGDLRAAGLRVNVRGFAFPTYIERLGRGVQGVFRYGWLAEYPSPDAFLSPLFDSASPDNHSGFKSRRVDRLLDDAHATRSDRKRFRLYRKAERVILKGLVVAPIGSFVSHWAARRQVEGISFDVLGGFDAAGVWLSE